MLVLPVLGQNNELTSSDNHALLYAHQLGFSNQAMPTVRMRIADGVTQLRFTPRSAFTVLPSGVDGAQVRLKGGVTYTVEIQSAHSGHYQYGAILARSESLADLNGAVDYCRAQDIDVEMVSIGAVFALRGTVFDSRENLLLTRRTDDRDGVHALRKSIHLPERLAVGRESEIPDIYTEVDRYPTGTVVLREASTGIEILNRNRLDFDFSSKGAVFYQIENENNKKEDIILNGQVVVTPDSMGKIAVVQSTDVETLLRGIVPAEIFASAPEAALEAQAIAARTTLMAQVGARHLAEPYHLCNRQHCQVYRGLSGADPRTDLAIQKTRGQVLVEGKKLAQTYYSAHCGGISSGRDEAWGLPPKGYLPTQTDNARAAAHGLRSDSDFVAWYEAENDSYCGGAPAGKKDFASVKHARWKVHLESREIDAALKKSGASVGKIQTIEVVERGPSFRATKLRITGDEGIFEVERELPIRRFLGGLKSALFVLRSYRKGTTVASVDVLGAGFGHGVGLCQTGAIGMAQRDIPAESILKHYFPGAKLVTLY